MTDLQIGFFGSLGKTAVCLSFLKNSYQEEYFHIDPNLVRTINLFNKDFNISILDAGQNCLNELKYTYFQRVQGYVLFYDLSEQESLENVKQLYYDIKESIDEEFYCVVAELNTKLRQTNQPNIIPKAEVESIKDELKCPFFEVSAETRTNVDEIIITLTETIINKKYKNFGITDIKSNNKKINIGFFGPDSKNTIILSFIKGIFYDEYMVDNTEERFEKTININDEDVNINIINVSEYESLNEMRYSYFSQVQSYILFYEKYNIESIENVKKLYIDIKASIDEEFYCVIAELNSELRQTSQSNLIPISETLKFSDELKCQIVEITSNNVNEVITSLAKKILKVDEIDTKTKTRTRKERKASENKVDKNQEKKIETKSKIKSKKEKKTSGNKVDKNQEIIIDHMKHEIEINIGLFGSDYKNEIKSIFLSTNSFNNSKICNVDNQLVKLNFIEVKEKDSFNEKTKSIFSQIQAYALFIDITNYNSINTVKRLYNDIIASPNLSSFYCVIGCLRSELRQQETIDPNLNLISQDEIEELSGKLKCEFFEISTINQENIGSVFTYLARKFLNYNKNEISYNVTLGKFFTNIKGEWNIGLIDIHDADADKLALKYSLGDQSELLNDIDHFNKFIEVDNVVVPLNLYVSRFKIDQSLFNKVQGFVFVIKHDDFHLIFNVLDKVVKETGGDFDGIVALNYFSVDKITSYSNYDKNVRIIEEKYNMKVLGIPSNCDENIEELFFVITKKMVLRKKMLIKVKNQVDQDKKKKIGEKKGQKKK